MYATSTGDDSVALFPLSPPYPSVLRLDRAWIDDMLALQAQAADGQLITRSRADLESLFDAGHTALGMINENGELIAQAAIRFNVNLPGILQRQFHKASYGGEGQALIGFVMSHPDYRGRGLMADIIADCLDECRSKGQSDAHARVRYGSEGSLKNFLRQDFIILAMGPSPEDQTKLVSFVHRPL